MSDKPSRQLFTALVSRPDDEVDLAHAALLVACEERPALPVDSYLQRLARMGDEVRRRLPPNPTAEQAASAINRFLFAEEGFRGNVEQYYDPRNSLLDQVLDRRLGIPITLTIVYTAVARRAGLRAEGVGLPGHFLARIGGNDGDVLTDPFHAGGFLSPRDCEQRVERLFEGGLSFDEGMLKATGPRATLARMLRNLKVIYGKNGDHPRTLAVLDLILILFPESAEDLRDRGLLYEALDCYTLAIRDLEACLSLHPQGPQAGALTERIAQVRMKAARLH